MDFLKQEIASKKRALDHIASATSNQSPSASDSDQPPPSKYIRRAELDRLRDEEEQRERARKEQDRKERLYGAAKRVAAKEHQTGTTLLPPSAAAGDKSRSASAGAEDAAGAAVEQSKPEAFNVSNDECVRRLRRIGQPIRLFAESDKDRRLRLRALELIEERTEGQRNDFMRAMEGQEIGLELAEVARRSNAGSAAAAAVKDKGKGRETLKDGSATATPEPAAGPAVEASGEKKEPKPKDEDVLVDLDLVRSNPHKVYPQIYHALKVRPLLSSASLLSYSALTHPSFSPSQRVLKEWEQSLADRPGAPLSASPCPRALDADSLSTPQRTSSAASRARWPPRPAQPRPSTSSRSSSRCASVCVPPLLSSHPRPEPLLTLRPTVRRSSRPTSCRTSPRSRTTCRSASTCAPTTPTCASRSATPPGRSASPWSASTSARAARRSSATTSRTS